MINFENPRERRWLVQGIWAVLYFKLPRLHWLIHRLDIFICICICICILFVLVVVFDCICIRSDDLKQNKILRCILLERMLSLHPILLLHLLVLQRHYRPLRNRGRRKHTWYLSFFLHEQKFWRIKFTPKKRVNYDKIYSKLPIFCVIMAKYRVNCQFFAFNL